MTFQIELATYRLIVQRSLDDSLDALQSTGHLNHSVTFICRIPDDIAELNVKNGSYSYKGKNFDFIDYKSFCCALCAVISDDDFERVLSNMAGFVQDMHISMRTKSGWNEFFAQTDN